jgi:hypothetical protein
MKTDDLIAAISADAKSARPSITQMVWLAAGVGVVAAALVFFAVLPVRTDIMEAMTTSRFLFKWVLTLSLLASALALVMQLARPQPVPRTRLLLLAAAPVVLAYGVVAELISLPSSDWMLNLVGNNAVGCMVLIPLLSALPLAALLVGLRQGAPSRPALAGAVAGLAATGIGATFYAAHCTNDSPLFLATWYVIATSIVTAAGALLGDRLLRW